MAYDPAGRSGGTAKTPQDQGVVVDCVSQKPLEKGEKPGVLSHIIHSPAARRLMVAARQFPLLDPEDRAALRKFVERDMEAVR